MEQLDGVDDAAGSARDPAGVSLAQLAEVGVPKFLSLLPQTQGFSKNLPI